MNSALLKGRSLLTWLNYSPEEIRVFLEACGKAKADSRKMAKRPRYRGKTMLVVGRGDSFFYRLAFENEFLREGGAVLSLQDDVSVGSAGLSWEDTARGLEGGCDLLLAQGIPHAAMEMMAKVASGFPICNLQSEQYSPVQALNIYFSAEELLRDTKGKRLVFVGDGRSPLSNSLMILCAKMGLDYTLVSPLERWPASSFKQVADSLAKTSGASLDVTAEPQAGVRGADVVVSAPWTSERPGVASGSAAGGGLAVSGPGRERYVVDGALMAATGNSGCIFFCDIPCARGATVAEGIPESPQSHVFQLARNQSAVVRAIFRVIL